MSEVTHARRRRERTLAFDQTDRRPRTRRGANVGRRTTRRVYVSLSYHKHRHSTIPRGAGAYHVGQTASRATPFCGPQTARVRQSAIATSPVTSFFAQPLVFSSSSRFVFSLSARRASLSCFRACFPVLETPLTCGRFDRCASSSRSVERNAVERTSRDEAERGEATGG